jgi:uncharacterized protein
LIVVGDASVLIILARIGLLHLLRDLFGRVLVPSSVRAEVDAPSHVAQQPGLRQAFDDGWLQVADDPDGLASGPGRGERAAIALAVALHADLLLVDDLDARKKAIAAGLAITGTIGVLRLARDEELITPDDDLIDRLTAAGFRSSPELLSQLRTE